ncbi:hypothetical protein LA76x_2006 [Lysobacter antibioticus]|uniref:Uncharacterized protein n=1 Tax=Lysobacter antibioticus TaxID=84531 RepID=A0A0S2F9C3_LYSAN|nr:hypothetical protein LA76x_2006 [Lysobacter antibioticus]
MTVSELAAHRRGRGRSGADGAAASMRCVATDEERRGGGASSLLRGSA